MYTELFELQSEFLKALAHPRRMEILSLLRGQQLCVSDIYEMLDLPQANISQHLMILRDAHVVKSHRVGKQIMYTISDAKILKAVDFLREVLIDQHEGSELAKQLTLDIKDLTPVVHDPVCKMRVSPKLANFSTRYKDASYFFCASGCLKKFKESPGVYVNA